MPATFESTKALLDQHGQSHLLTFFDQLNETDQQALLDQINGIDFNLINRLIESHVKSAPELDIPTDLHPAKYYPAQPSAEQESKYAEARTHGEELIKSGQVAAFTVAGGQGTRLGWPGPKGTYPASPIREMSLFRIFAESIAKTQNKYDVVIPWYIMTSPINDTATRTAFKEADYFGLSSNHIMFFQQGTIPSVSYDGKLMLASKGEVAVNPDGHGGSLKALAASGAVADMKKRGITQVSYFQIDNPLVKCIDPLFIGLHALDGAQMSSKMVAKADPFEKVGLFCEVDGRIRVTEYSNLPDELAVLRNEDDSLQFNAGSIAIHVIALQFVEELNAGEFSLPYQRADKKVPHLDLSNGELVQPDTPNAVKMETFVFDALPLCATSIVLETSREEEFAPVKNAEGNDSAITSKQAQSDRAGRWLEAAGVRIPWKDGHVDATIDLSPLTAIEPEDLTVGDVELPAAISPGDQVTL